MYNISKIEDAVQGYICITVSIDGENHRYTVRISVYEEIGMPHKGDVIDEDALYALTLADEYYRAKRAALSILSFGDNNERTLHTKLRTRGISDEVATDVVHEMVSLGYIDEARQLERLITEAANRKLHGPRKIVPHLMSKGYRSSDIKSVLSSLCDSGEIDFEENKERLLDKHLGDSRDTEAVKKLLYKHGYNI